MHSPASTLSTPPPPLSSDLHSNFEDGAHQDALDILLEKRPLSDHYALDLKARPYAKSNQFKARPPLTPVTSPP